MAVCFLVPWGCKLAMKSSICWPETVCRHNQVIHVWVEASNFRKASKKSTVCLKQHIFKCIYVAKITLLWYFFR